MNEVPRISPAEAHLAMNDHGHTYVDVRTEEEFAGGHPKGAVNVPLMHMGATGLEPNVDFLDVMQKAFAKDAPLIVGCKAGGRSARAARALLEAGFTSVLEQRAGWDGVRGTFGEITEKGWRRLELPVEEGETADRSYRALRSRVEPSH